MAVVYSQDVINARLNGVVTALGATASLVLSDGATTVVTISLANPVGAVSGGVLTFTTPGTLGTAVASGTVDTAVILDSAAATAISGLSVGIPLSAAQVIIANGLNSTVISSGQPISLIAAQIVGS